MFISYTEINSYITQSSHFIFVMKINTSLDCKSITRIINNNNWLHLLNILFIRDINISS